MDLDGTTIIAIGSFVALVALWLVAPSHAPTVTASATAEREPAAAAA